MKYNEFEEAVYEIDIESKKNYIYFENDNRITITRTHTPYGSEEELSEDLLTVHKDIANAMVLYA